MNHLMESDAGGGAARPNRASGPALTKLDSALALQWPEGEAVQIPFLWLRDNCSCPECRILQTAEKQFHLINVDLDLSPEQLSVSTDSLFVIWPGGHTTEYPLQQLRTWRARSTPQWQPWAPSFEPGRFSFYDFLSSDVCASEAIQRFLVDGCILLQSAPDLPGILEHLVSRLGPLRELLFDRIHNVVVDPKGYNIAHTALPLPPHTDFASYTWPPSVQTLHMLCNETSGGNSIIVDGWSVLQGLREEHPRWFELLHQVPVPFREFDEHNETYTEVPMVQCDSVGNVTSFRYSNQLMQTMDPAQSQLADFYHAYYELSLRIAAPEARCTFRMAGGDIMILANHRVLHGREAFEPTGRRHIQDAYFEHDNVRNHWTVLQRSKDL